MNRAPDDPPHRGPHAARVALALLTGVLVAGAVSPAAAHERSLPWLDQAKLEAGLFVEIRHPRAVRKAQGFDVSAHVMNLSAAGPVVVEEIRFEELGSERRSVRTPQRTLSSKGSAVRRYQRIRERLDAAYAARDLPGVRSLHDERGRVLAEIQSSVFGERWRVPPERVPAVGSSLALRVEIDVLAADGPHTLRRTVEIPVQPPLPRGVRGDWFAGDQHLHTVFSIDAFFLDGTRELISDYAMTAEAVGLDWIIITDHTNIGFLGWYSPWMFALSELLAVIYRVSADYLVLQGQEMGVGGVGAFGEPAHLLVYPRTQDSTGFLPNPCVGLVVNHVNCEPEQTVIDRVNDAGGIGFIAHPFDFTPLAFAPWNIDRDIVGWAGVEILNSSSGVFDVDDERSIEWWHEQLSAIERPRGGVLAERPDFPTRFPVGLGNSDAHQPAHIGATFTYARVPNVSSGAGMLPRAALLDAFVGGRVVASNGPLVYGEINGAGTGEVAVLEPASNLLRVTVETTPEFGPVGDYELTVLVDGVPRAVVPPSGNPAFRTTLALDNRLAPPDKFVTLRIERTNCLGCPPETPVYQAIANPIWLQFTEARGSVFP